MHSPVLSVTTSREARRLSSCPSTPETVAWFQTSRVESSSEASWHFSIMARSLFS